MALFPSPIVGPGKLGAQWGARAGAVTGPVSDRY